MMLILDDEEEPSPAGKEKAFQSRRGQLVRLHPSQHRRNHLAAQ
jgi:hypothetical protein